MDISITTGEVIDQWLDTLPSREKYIRKNSILKRFYRMFKDRIFSSLTTDDIFTYVEKCVKDGIQGSSIQTELSTIRQVIDDGRSQCGIEGGNNPIVIAREILSGQKYLARNPRRDQRVSDKSLYQILSCSTSIWLPSVCQLVLDTTMKEREILQWEPEHIQGKKLFVPARADTKYSYIPLSENTGFLLSNMPDFPRNDKVISGVFHRAREKAMLRFGEHLRGIRFSDLRNEAIHRLFELGLTSPKVQVYSGHKRLESLQYYVGPCATVVADKVSMLERAQQNRNPLQIARINLMNALQTHAGITSDMMSQIAEVLERHAAESTIIA